MPELPEVETIRRSLDAAIVGARVDGVTLRRPGYVAGGLEASDLLVGGVIASVRRHGKQQAIVTRDGRALCVQLGMSGQLLLTSGGDASEADDPSHTHVAWSLRNAGGRAVRLLMRDPRRFGGVTTFADVRTLEAEHWSKLGPDALTISDQELARALARTTRAVKAAILDQSLIAGVGNIYADESLHIAGVHPAIPADRLSTAKACRLAGAIRAVLARAVEARGSTMRDYRDPAGDSGGYFANRLVYGRPGEPCRSCGARLRSGSIAQRTTTWCPKCQRSPRSVRIDVIHNEHTSGTIPRDTTARRGG